MRTGDAQGGYDLADRVLNSSPDDPWALSVKAHAAFELGSADEGRQLLDDARNALPPVPEPDLARYVDELEHTYGMESAAETP